MDCSLFITMKHWLICVRQADKNLPLLQLTFIHNGVVERSYERWGLVVGICDSDGHCSCGSLLWTASISGNYLLKHANKCACITHTHAHTHTKKHADTHKEACRWAATVQQLQNLECRLECHEFMGSNPICCMGYFGPDQSLH